MFNDQSITHFEGGPAQSQRNFNVQSKSGNSFHGRNASLPGGMQGKSLLSAAGSNVLSVKMPPLKERVVKKQTNYMRKGEGRGGSPTEYDQVYRSNEDSPPDRQSKKFDGQFVPMSRKNNLTQVRIRQKDSGYVYGQGQISEVQMSAANQQSAGQTSMLWEKKRMT